VNNFRQRCINVAERFLQTAVIVDDQAYIDDSSRPPGRLKTPNRETTAMAQASDLAEQTQASARHDLDAKLLVDSFAERGLICAVIAPRPGIPLASTVGRTARRADIVLLDWQINDDDGKRALSILNQILLEDKGERLRLIAIYTGEQDIVGIGRTIREELEKLQCKFNVDDRGVAISFGHTRIVVYAKAETHLISTLKDRSVSEQEIPEHLISDFAEMNSGLLPCAALTSLTAIRDNAHKILDRFDSTLDAPFLAHRACLPDPSDSEQHIVSQIASELHSIMDDATVSEKPAGMEAIKEWLEASFGANADVTFAANKKLSFADTVALLDQGIGERPGVLSKKNDYEILTAGFDRDRNPENKLDLQLAWLINFRTVFNAPPPILHLGTVVGKRDSMSPGEFFLCMRPRCESVRLHKSEAFLLLPLIEPTEKTIQLVIRTCEGAYYRRSVCTRASQWSLVSFTPIKTGGAIVARKGDGNCFLFTADDKTEFEWLGELKHEFAHRIAHRFATGLSRVAVDNSEWLRRSEKLDD
jgi:hypothetical protein